MSLLLRAERNLLYEDEEITLQQTLKNSFDMSHPDFTKEMAIANLRRSFTITVDLCDKCLIVRYQDELNQNQGLCNKCASTEETLEISEDKILEEPTKPESPQPTEPDQRILQLENRVQKLEQLNQQLIQLLVNDSQVANERAQQIT